MKNGLFVGTRYAIEIWIALGVFGVLAFFWNGTDQGVYFEKFFLFAGFVAVFVLLWGMRSLLSGSFVWIRLPIERFFLTMLASGGVSVMLSDNVHRSLWGTYKDPFVGFMGLVLLCGLSFLVANVYNRRVFGAISIASILSGGVLSFGVLSPFFPSIRDVSAPTLFTVIFSGVLFTVTALSATEVRGFFRGVAQKIQTVALIFSLILSFFAIARIFEPGLWWPTLVGFCVYAIFVLSGRVALGAGSAFALTLCAFFLGGWYIVYDSFGQFRNVNNDIRPDVSVMWEVAKGSFLDRPVFGYGPGLYEQSYALHAPSQGEHPSLVGMRFLSASGGGWEWISTLGALGVLVFVVLLAGGIGIAWHALGQSGDNRDLLSFFSIFSMVLPVVLFFDYNGVVLFLLFLSFGGLMGIVAHRYVGKWTEATLRIDSRYMLALIFILTFVVIALLFTALRGKQIVDAGQLVKQARETESLENAVALLERAIGLDPKEAHYHRRLGEIYAAQAVEASLLPDADVALLELRYNMAFSAASEAIRLDPGSVSHTESLARLYEAAGVSIPEALDLAAEQYTVLERMEPGNPIHSFRRGMVLLRLAEVSGLAEEEKKKKVRQSIEAFESALAKGKNFPAAHYQLALAYKQAGDTEKAIAYARDAIEAMPQDVSVILLLASLLLDNPDRGEEVGHLLRSAERLMPNDPAIFLYYGRWHAQHYRKEEARAAYEKAKTLLSEDQAAIVTHIDGLIEDLNSVAAEENVSATPG